MVGRYDPPAVDNVDVDGELRSVLERISAHLRQQHSPVAGSPAEDAIVARFVRAYESADIAALVELFTDNGQPAFGAYVLVPDGTRRATGLFTSRTVEPPDGSFSGAGRSVSRRGGVCTDATDTTE
jgi:hypothetical protein